MAQGRRREIHAKRFGMVMTPTFWRELNEYAERTGRDMSEIARSGIEREIREQKAVPVPADTVALAIKPEIQQRLAEFCRPFGYLDVPHFLEDMARRSLAKPPDEVREFLLGRFAADRERAAAEERARMADEKKGKRNDKAA